MENQSFIKLSKFFSRHKKLSFKKGEIILRIDDEPRGVLYIKKGYTKVYSIAKNAQELTLLIFKAGDFFPMTWAVNGTFNHYYVEAVTDVELYQAPREEFFKFIKNNPDVLLEITSRILTRFGGLLSRMEHAILGNARSKVASIILILAERFGKENDKKLIIQVPLTHQDIANLIGVARETVSIEMKKLQERNLISYKGKYLIVKDYQQLEEESALGSTD